MSNPEKRATVTATLEVAETEADRWKAMSAVLINAHKTVRQVRQGLAGLEVLDTALRDLILGANECARNAVTCERVLGGVDRD